MIKIITWKCSECGNEDKYPADDDVTLQDLQTSQEKNNTMCSICGGPCFAIDVEQKDTAD